MNALSYLLILISKRVNPLHVEDLANRMVLDVGCGEGDFMAKDPLNRVGVDIDAELVRRCKGRGLDARCMSATKLGFPDDSFDAVHGAELIEHFEPKTAVQFLSEAARVLKPGGIVYLTTPGERYVWNTFSHVRPYPPIAFKKLFGTSTEGFIQDNSIPLKLECYFAFRRVSHNRLITGLMNTLNVAIPPRWPSGYVLILRKNVIVYRERHR